MSAFPRNQREFEGETFEGLAEADLAGRTFRDCTFLAPQLTEADLRNARLVDCRFEGGSLANARLTGARLTGVLFEKVKLLGLDFRQCDETLFDAGFRGCDLSYALFPQMRLKKAVFAGSRLVEADFEGADLTGADLTGCDLSGARFGRTVLKTADLRGATGYVIDPRTNELKGARVSLPEAAGLLAPFGLRIG